MCTLFTQYSDDTVATYKMWHGRKSEVLGTIIHFIVSDLGLNHIVHLMSCDVNSDSVRSDCFSTMFTDELYKNILPNVTVGVLVLLLCSEKVSAWNLGPEGGYIDWKFLLCSLIVSGKHGQYLKIGCNHFFVQPFQCLIQNFPIQCNTRNNENHCDRMSMD
jgi:hypothetical protein